MGPRGRKTATLATIGLLAVAPVSASAKTIYAGDSKNDVTNVTGHAGNGSTIYAGDSKNDGVKSATGSYPVAQATPVVASASSSDDGFEWGHAAAGAGVALLLSGTAAAGIATLRRREHRPLA